MNPGSMIGIFISPKSLRIITISGFNFDVQWGIEISEHSRYISFGITDGSSPNYMTD